MDFSNIRFLGRHIFKDNKAYFSYSGSGFEFCVEPLANNLSISLTLESLTRDHDRQYIAIYVDNELLRKEKLLTGDNIVQLTIDNRNKSLIRIIKLNETMRAKAMASVVLNDAICINDIRIMEGEKGPFISMPSRRKENGQFKDIAHPINQETREKIQSAILEEYKKQ